MKLRFSKWKKFKVLWVRLDFCYHQTLKGWSKRHRDFLASLLKENNKSYIFTKEELLHWSFLQWTMHTFLMFEGSISFCYLAEEQNNTWETCIRKVRGFEWNSISESVKEGSWCKIIKHEYWNRECGISFAKTQHWFQYHDGLSLSSNLEVHIA